MYRILRRPSQHVRGLLSRALGFSFQRLIDIQRFFLFAIVGAEYVLNLLPRGTHDYEKLIKPSELQRAARDAGLQWRQSKGMTYNPLFKTYKLVDGDLSVNYLMAFQKH